jgi:hypothetical protein
MSSEGVCDGDGVDLGAEGYGSVRCVKCGTSNSTWPDCE